MVTIIGIGIGNLSPNPGTVSVSLNVNTLEESYKSISSPTQLLENTKVDRAN